MNNYRIKFGLLVALLTFSFTVFGASKSDSLTVVSADWRVSRMADGLELKTFHFDQELLFGSKQYISIIEVDFAELSPELKLDVLAIDGLDLTSAVASQTGALAAINGSFFNVRPPYNSVDYVRVDGQLVAPNKPHDSGRVSTQNGSIVIDGRRVSIVEPADPINSEDLIKGEDILTSGPLLKLKGKDQVIRDESHFYGRHPRTAIAITTDGVVLLITVDGRSDESAGMTIMELQSLVSWLGAKDALNLD